MKLTRCDSQANKVVVVTAIVLEDKTKFFSSFLSVGLFLPALNLRLDLVELRGQVTLGKTQFSQAESVHWLTSCCDNSLYSV